MVLRLSVVLPRIRKLPTVLDGRAQDTDRWFKPLRRKWSHCPNPKPSLGRRDNRHTYVPSIMGRRDKRHMYVPFITIPPLPHLAGVSGPFCQSDGNSFCSSLQRSSNLSRLSFSFGVFNRSVLGFGVGHLGNDHPCSHLPLRPTRTATVLTQYFIPVGSNSRTLTMCAGLSASRPGLNTSSLKPKS